MGDVILYAVVVFVAACAGTYLGTFLSVRGPKKRIQGMEEVLHQALELQMKTLELTADHHVAIGDLAGMVGEIKMNETVAKYGKGE